MPFRRRIQVSAFFVSLRVDADKKKGAVLLSLQPCAPKTTLHLQNPRMRSEYLRSHRISRTIPL